MSELYLFSTVLGAAFVVLTNLIGHGGHGGHGGGGHGGDSGGHADGLDLFSPTAIAAYITGFGSAGLLLMHGLGVESPWVHVPLSIGAAGAFGASVLWGLARVRHHTEGNSKASLADLVGTEVEVTVTIPAGGLGEVAFESGGSRLTQTARAEGAQTFKQGTTVQVAQVTEEGLLVTATRPAILAPVSAVSEGVPDERVPQKDRLR
jgi:membrane protein implicated in regulation of membrane protease activity